MQRTDVKPRAEVLAEVSRWLETTHGIRMLGALGFENAYALAMPRARAEKLGIRSIADLARTRRNSRSPATTNSSSARNGRRSATPMACTSARSAPCSRISCIRPRRAGDVDVVSAYTSDGRIAQFDLAVLDDPKHAIPPYDAILLLSPQARQ